MNGPNTLQRRGGLPARKTQLGVSLVELLVATVVSLIAISGMVLMMSSSLGATTTVVTSARLANELQAARQVVMRDLRRANFNEDFASCIGAGQSTCLSVPDTLTVSLAESYTSADAGCLAWRYERSGTEINGAVRRPANGNALQFRTDDDSCADSANWEDLNDTDVVTITRFTVSDDPSYSLDLPGGLTQQVRKYAIEIEGQACLNAACTETVTRAVTHTVRVRNDVLVTTP